MLNAIAPGAVSSATNPILDFWAQRAVTDGGFTFYGLGVPETLSFQIWDLRNLDAPAQLFPVTPGQKQAVNLTTDRVDGVDGHYAAAWTCSVSASSKGRYQIRWYHVPTVGAAELVTLQDFDVLPAAGAIASAGTGYALVSDLRAEGVRPEDLPDARLLRLLDLQSRYIERATRRSFRPVYKTVVLNGSGGRVCMFGEPLIALVGVSLGQPPTTDVVRSTFRVFNRHLSNGMLDPDDRADPKIEFAHFSDLILGRRGASLVGSPLFGVPWRDHYFPEAVQNVTVRGLWGYTEHDGSPTGRTPSLITHAAKLLVMREMHPMGTDEREDAQNRWRLTSERTRDQSYTRTAAREGGFTGDQEIDAILDAFAAPIDIGSA